MQLADLEYFYVAKEMNGRFMGSRIGKIYQVTGRLFKIQVSNDDGKFTLIIQLPDYLTSTKRDIPSPERPSNFIMALRKRLANGIIESIEQPGFERIIIFNISSHGKHYRLVVELFSHGNIILCDSARNNAIDVIYRKESWRDRELKRGVPYVLPPSKLSPFLIEPRHISLNGKKTLMAGILSQVSVAPKYLEEAFVRAGIDPHIGRELHPEDRERLLYMIKGVCAEGNYYTYSKDGKIVDYSVAHLTKYESGGYEKARYKSVLEMIDAAYEPVLSEEEEVGAAKGEDEKGRHREAAMAKMKERLAALEAEELRARASAMHIHKDYHKVEHMIGLVRQMRKQGKSEREISKALSQIDKDAQYKNGMIILRIRC
ncbi:MAG: NFACT family protein [Candidatus Micrarchaeota archaeon]|nr:NFACT family protein [Candidatus Micrarchaeota archaeon]